jgi:uncharacterized circularly permuted ATP-grasp superfamily protein
LAWDEVFSAPGVPRPLYKEIVDVLADLKTAEIRSRFDQLGRTFAERGVTFALGGEERPFPLDLIPRIIAAFVSGSWRWRRFWTTSTDRGSVSTTVSYRGAS